jgi:isoleucyl-tRNA synthetase
MKGLITGEVRADSLELKADKSIAGALVKDWDVEGIPMAIGIQKV